MAGRMERMNKEKSQGELPSERDSNEECQEDPSSTSRRQFLHMTTAGAVVSLVTASCAKEEFGMPDGGDADSGTSGDGDTDGDADIDGDSEADSNSDSDSDSETHADSDSDSDVDSNTDSDSDADTESDIDTHSTDDTETDTTPPPGNRVVRVIDSGATSWTEGDSFNDWNRTDASHSMIHVRQETFMAKRSIGRACSLPSSTAKRIPTTGASRKRRCSIRQSPTTWRRSWNGFVPRGTSFQSMSFKSSTDTLTVAS